MKDYVLTSLSAQIIVNYIMQNTPYNINIMDDQGTIIASGKKDRIGNLHKGAIRAIKEKRPILVYENTETEKKGINLPILHDEKVVGVIGISGDVEEVLPLGRMTASFAQLMIENQIFMEMSSVKEIRIQDFLLEWTKQDYGHYSSKLLDQAKYFHIDLDKKRVAVILICRKPHQSVIDKVKAKLDSNEFVLSQGMEQLTLLMLDNKKLRQRVNNMFDLNEDIIKCYVGEPSPDVKKACTTALETMEISEKLKIPTSTVFYSDIALETFCMQAYPACGEVLKNAELLSTHDMKEDLVNTIYTYVNHSDSLTDICSILHIHRNTLNYRIQKILDLTGLNLKNCHDAMKLFIVSLTLLNETSQ